MLGAPEKVAYNFKTLEKLMKIKVFTALCKMHVSLVSNASLSIRIGNDDVVPK